MNVLQGLLTGVLLAGYCLAQVASTADWQHKADEAKGMECVHLSMHAARLSLEDANALFGRGEAKKAHEDVDVSVRYVRRAVDCSLQSRRGEKSLEIDIRKLIRRMKDILQTLDSEDRAHLSQSMTELEKQRDRLLRALFGTAAGGGPTEKKR